MPAIEVHRSGAACRIALNRPPLNVLDIPTVRALNHELQEVAHLVDVKVVILESKIPGVFSAGVDIRDHAKQHLDEMLDRFHSLFDTLDDLPQAVVAAVDGTCLGGGCELAMFCDVLLATPRSTFGQPEIDVGCFPPVAAVLLPRIAGRHAVELVLSGRRFGALEAERLGIINRVVEDLDSAVEEYVETFGAKSGRVLTLARRAVRRGGAGAFRDALTQAEFLYRGELSRTKDMEEGLKAFLEKRPPRWHDA